MSVSAISAGSVASQIEHPRYQPPSHVSAPGSAGAAPVASKAQSISHVTVAASDNAGVEPINTLRSHLLGLQTGPTAANQSQQSALQRQTALSAYAAQQQSLNTQLSAIA